MKIYRQDQPNTSHKEFIFQVWNKEYPHHLSFGGINDLDSYLSGLKNAQHFFVEGEAQQPVAWACLFDREEEKWFAMIIDSSAQHQGIGSQLLKKITEDEPCVNGWVIDHDTDFKRDGSTYSSPLNFYLKNNFTVCEKIRLETTTLSAVKIQWTSKQHA